MTINNKTVQFSYRDSFFRDFFLDISHLLSLCNALLGTDSTDVNDIVINTLEGNFFSRIKNDLSCLFQNRFMVIIEHQSTINENMPIRILFYAAELYDRYLSKCCDKNALYREKLIQLPQPEFFVLYNGNAKEVETRTLSLADAFKGDNSVMDLKVTLLNINYGYNRELLERCSYLKEYCSFVDYVKRRLSLGSNVKRAVIETVNYCLENNIMADYLSGKKEEFFSMLDFEFDWNVAKEVMREEAIADGRAQGIAEGRAKGIAEGRAKGMAEGRAEGMADGIVKGRLETLLGLVKKGFLTLAQAAEEANMTVPEFEAKVMAINL